MQETELRSSLNGHEAGNGGDSQGKTYGLPRLCPTLQRGGGGGRLAPVALFCGPRFLVEAGFFIRTGIELPIEALHATPGLLGGR